LVIRYKYTKQKPITQVKEKEINALNSVLAFFKNKKAGRKIFRP
jgi:hypothetical protein